MKKTLLSFTALTLVGVSTPTASAGDKEWATAGKVLTGIFAAKVITRALEPAPVYTYQAPVYYVTPTVVAQPAPAVQFVPQQVPVSSTPVLVYPQPVYVQSAPMVLVQPMCAPQPRVFVSVPPVFNVQFGGGYYRSHHYIRR